MKMLAPQRRWHGTLFDSQVFEPKSGIAEGRQFWIGSGEEFCVSFGEAVEVGVGEGDGSVQDLGRGFSFWEVELVHSNV